MKIREEILMRLLQSDAFISGEQLSEELAVSRTSVWKHIKKLKEEGYEIESVTNKGYRISSEHSGLSESRLLIALEKSGIATVKLYDRIDSTNLEAKRFATDFEGQALFLAKEQTQGKGRRGKNWESPVGSGLYFSLLLRPNLLPRDAAMITLLAGIAVAEGLQKVFGLKAGIKWPNDLVVSNKKLCGILTEMSSEIESLNYIVIGIGINLTQEVFPDELREMATSVLMERMGSCDEEEILKQGHDLVVNIVQRIAVLVGQFEKSRDLGFVLDEYNARCVNVGRKVRILEQKGEFFGVAKGIDANGELIVEKEDGSIEKITSGEVSVRGIYGYV